MINDSSLVIKKKEIDSTDFNDEKVMMDIEKGKYFALNEIGSIIWDKLDKKIKVSSLVDELLSEYEIDRNECSKDVIEYLEQLNKENLIIVE